MVRFRCAVVALLSLLLWTLPLTANASPGLVPLDRVTLASGQVEAIVGQGVTLVHQGPFDPMDALRISDQEQLDHGISDSYLDKVDDATRQGYDREFESTTHSQMIRIRTIEFVNHAWASDFSGPEDIPAGTDLPVGTHVEHQEGKNGGGTVAARVTVGRVLVIVLIRTRMDSAAPSATPQLFATLDRQASALLAAQLATIPPTEDLASGNAYDLSSQRVQLGILLMCSIAFLAVGYSVLIGLRDRGTRERWRRQRAPEPTGAQIVDVTSRVRRARRKVLLKNILVLTAIVAWAGFCYFGTGRLRLLPTMGIFVGGICLVAVLQLWLLTRRDTSAVHMPGFMLSAVGMVGAVTLLTFCALMIVAAITGGFFFVGAFFWIPALGLLLLGLRAMQFTAKPMRLAKRLAAPSVAESLARDRRPGVMLLRSFQDDDLEIRMHTSSRHSALEFVSTESHERFEELVAWTLWRYGPVIAIGQPGTVLAPLGAAREYHDDDSWQQAVHNHIADSELVAFVVGRSPGLLWEVATVRRLGALGKTLFVFPPEEPDEINARITVLCAALDIDPRCIPRQSASTRPILALYLDPYAVPTAVVAHGRDDIAYQEVMTYVADQLSVAPPGVMSEPDPRYRLDGQRPDQLLATFDPRVRRAPRKRVVSAALDRILGFV